MESGRGLGAQLRELQEKAGWKAPPAPKPVAGSYVLRAPVRASRVKDIISKRETSTEYQGKTLWEVIVVTDADDHVFFADLSFDNRSKVPRFRVQLGDLREMIAADKVRAANPKAKGRYVESQWTLLGVGDWLLDYGDGGIMEVVPHARFDRRFLLNK